MRYHWLIGLTALGLVCRPAWAQDVQVDIGLLTCSLGADGENQTAPQSVPMIEAPAILCSFRPFESGPEETYIGTIESIGQSKDLSDKRAMIWIVKATLGTEASPGLLQQSYSADAAAPNPRQSPPRLIGQGNQGIVLQSMSEAGREVSAADARAPADKNVQDPGATIVFLSLKLRSTPA